MGYCDLSGKPGNPAQSDPCVHRSRLAHCKTFNLKENNKMWKFFYELTPDQKRQARDLDSEVRMYPSEFEYYVDEDGDVTGYERIIR